MTGSNNSRLATLTALLCALAAPLPAEEPTAAPDDVSAGAIVDAFEFDVYLDDQLIGSHAWTIREPAPGERVVYSEADFAVRFLFVTAYEYEHRNVERWRDGCLSGLSSRTNRNGEAITVEGQKTDEGFVVATGDEEQVLPHCVMSFAYWSPAFLDQGRLLNPQTGQFEPVDVERQGDAADEQGAVTYLIRARDKEIRVHYSRDRQWVGLEAPAKGGRVLRYVLS